MAAADGAMAPALPDIKTLYNALQARDPAFEGRAWVGVTSTGIFCRPTCPAITPKPENCRFFASPAACVEAGFRPCKRCTPFAAKAGDRSAFASADAFRAAFAQISGQAPGDLAGDTPLCADFIDTPLGPMIAVADASTLRLLEFSGRGILSRELAALREANGRIGLGRLPPTEAVAAALARYFAGESARFDMDLAPSGTAFQQSVWAELRRIPPGETRSYGEIARRIGRPRAVRAVAAANGANPIALVIPCHRVIGADGTLTGYGGGLWRKRWLIGHEAELPRHG